MMYCVVKPTGAPMLSLGPVIDSGRVVHVWDKDWLINPNPDQFNEYLSGHISPNSEAHGLIIVYGTAQCEVENEQEFERILKHWQSLALVHGWNKCPKCGGFVPSTVDVGRYVGALSRWDNKTIVCSDCGQREAFLQQQGKDISPEGDDKWFNPPGSNR